MGSGEAGTLNVKYTMMSPVPTAPASGKRPASFPADSIAHTSNGNDPVVWDPAGGEHGPRSLGPGSGMGASMCVAAAPAPALL